MPKSSQAQVSVTPAQIEQTRMDNFLLTAHTKRVRIRIDTIA